MEEGKGKLTVIDTSTGVQISLTDEKGQPIYGLNPKWADQDKAIIFQRTPASGYEIWQYSLATKTLTRLYPFAAEK